MRTKTIGAALAAAALLDLGCATRCWYEPDGALADTSETHFERDMAECRLEGTRVSASARNAADGLAYGNRVRELCMQAKGYRIQRCPG